MICLQQISQVWLQLSISYMPSNTNLHCHDIILHFAKKRIP